MQAKQKKKILLLGTQMAIAGAQKVLLTQGQWFHENGYAVVAAFLYDKESLHEVWRKEHSFEIINFDIWEKDGNILRNLYKFLFGIFRIFRFLKTNNFDVIESFTIDSNLIGIPLAYFAGIPMRVPTVHGFVKNRPKFLTKIHGKLINSQMSNCLVVVSNRVRQDVIEKENVKKEKIVVILNGIPIINHAMTKAEARKLLGWPQDAAIIINVGRLVVEKGQKYLIDALPSVIEKYPQVHGFIAGEGDLHISLEHQIREKQLQDRIELLGVRLDIAEILRASDIFVLPSVSEGLPIALLEAMAAECPVVVSDVEGIDDVVVHGKNGLVIPIGNVEASSSAIIKLLSNPDLREQMGKAARAHVEKHFSVDAMCKKYEEVFLAQYL